MKDLPPELQRRLVDEMLRGRQRAYVRANADGTVAKAGGELEWFGLGALERGDSLEERVIALQEFDTGSEPAVLPRVQLVADRSTDLHLLPDGDGTLLFLVDATPEAERELRFQAQGNLLSLLLRTVGIAVFEANASNELRLLSLTTAWMRALLGGGQDVRTRFPFVDNFLVDARATWEGSGPRLAWSGQWSEEGPRGTEWFLEAAAARLDNGRRLLVIQNAGRGHEERQRILQQARSRTLHLDRLQREIDKKEILLHCIVHDLKGPLSSMVGSMSLIKSRELDPERTRELLELGLEQARSQESMIRAILDAFSAEVDALEHFESDAASAPDLLACVRAAVETYAPAFEQAGVALETVRAPDLAERTPVVGEESRLIRVLHNLLENALQNSPERTRVRVSVERVGSSLGVSIVDQGRGIPEEDRAGLFDKLRQSGASRGMSGLGLYFCRSMLEMWGGTIEFQPGEERGACFRFELPEAF